MMPGAHQFEYLGSCSSEFMPGCRIDNPLLRAQRERETCEGECQEGSASEEAHSRLPLFWSQPDNDPNWKPRNLEGAVPLCTCWPPGHSTVS